MKRPEVCIKWMPIMRERDGIFVDYNGKPSSRYYIPIPYWLARAYERGNLLYAKVEIRTDTPCGRDRLKESNDKVMDEYFKQNWSRKVIKMRKLNHGYLLVKNPAKDKRSKGL